MVDIPQRQDPTLQAIRFSLHGGEKRDYLGASYVGHDCARRVWYTHNTPQNFDSDTLLRFADGHRSEAAMAEMLRRVHGVELWTEDGQGNQFGFEDGNFKGHIDGVIRGLLHAPRTTAIWEHKSTEALSDFRKHKEKHGTKGALSQWNYTYYVQAQIYMHYFDLKRHYLTVASPGLRDFDSAWTEYDKAVALKYIDRAHKLLAQDTEPPRAYNSQTDWRCRMCPFSRECWG